jgi:hypothetical protein
MALSDDKSQDGRSPVPGMLAGAAVAGTPFLGLIGQKPIINDPYSNPNIRRTTLGELDRLARPGDLFLTNKRHGTGFKSVQMPQGTEFYHAQPVVARHSGLQGEGPGGFTFSANELSEPQFKNMSRRQLLREYGHNIKGTARSSHYSDILLMRPKTPLTPEQQRVFADEAIARAKVPYGKARSAAAWLRDIFVPKIGPENTKVPKGYTCKSDVCSTLPANAYAKATGKAPFAQKSPGMTMPADYLRAGSAYEPVAAHLSYKGLTPKQLRFRALATRAGIGGVLGATAYAGVNDPTTLPVLPAAVLAPMAGAKIYEQIKARMMMKRYKHLTPALRNRLMERAGDKASKALPNFFELIESGKDPSVAAKQLRKNMLRRSLPLGLAAGAGMYGLTRLLKSRLGKSEPEKETT